MTPTYASAVAAYAEAGITRVLLRLHDGQVQARGAPPGLVAKLRRHKADLAAILAGSVCRCCGRELFWDEPGCLVFADGSGSCLRCHEAVP